MSSLRFRRTLLLVTLVALAVRIALLSVNLRTHPELLRLAEEETVRPVETPHVSPFGYEASNIARALVCEDRGFADPFGAPTGPTAWIAPGVVALYASAFFLFGCFTPESVLFVFAVAIALSTATTALAGLAGLRWLGDPGAGIVGASLVALSPFDLSFYIGASTFGLSLHGFFLVLLLILLLGVERHPTRGRLATIGAAAALATLCNPVFAAVAGCGLLIALRRRGLRWIARGVALLVAFQLLLVVPYLAYQRVALGAWVPVKSNALFELYLGSRDDVAGVLDASSIERHHPSQNRERLERYRAGGEIAFVRDAGRALVRDLTASGFLHATRRRIGAYYFGAVPLDPASSTRRAAVQRIVFLLPGLVLLAYPVGKRFRLGRRDALIYGMVLVYSAPHLLATVMTRYVIPITPLALLVLAALVRSAFRGSGESSADLPYPTGAESAG